MIWSTPAVQVGGAASSGSVSSLTATFGSGVTAGNLAIVAFNLFSSSGSAPSITVSDQEGNTWSLHSSKAQNDQSSGTFELWYIYSLIVPPASNGVALAVTVTLSAATYYNIGIGEFSFTGGTPAVDASLVGAAGLGPSPVPTTPSISVAGSGPALIIAGAETNATSGHNVTTGSGYTQIFQNNYAPGTSLGACFQYQLNATSAQTASWGWNGTGIDRWNCAGGSFKLVPTPVMTPYRTGGVLRPIQLPTADLTAYLD